MNEKLNEIFIELEQLEKNDIENKMYQEIHDYKELLFKYNLYTKEDIENLEGYNKVEGMGKYIFFQDRRFFLYLKDNNPKHYYIFSNGVRNTLLVFDELSNEEKEKLEKYDDLINVNSDKSRRDYIILSSIVTIGSFLFVLAASASELPILMLGIIYLFVITITLMGVSRAVELSKRENRN